MRYESKFANSFSRMEPQKLGFSAIAGCFLISLLYFTFFDPYMNPSNILKFPAPITNSIPNIVEDNNRNSKEAVDDTRKLKPICDVSDNRYDVCEIHGDVWINGKSSSVIYDDANVNDNANINMTWKIRPYARKGDGAAMGGVKEVSVESVLVNRSRGSHHHLLLQCHVNHTVPAIVFSIGGYTGNFFHDFTDVIIPLFLTSHKYNGRVQFVITDMSSWWINKYKLILTALSNYQFIDFNNDNRTHCFRQAIVGLHCHKELSIVPSRSPIGYSMVDFTWFMRRTFSLNRNFAIRTKEHMKKKKKTKKPRLLIISRSRTRRLRNVDEIGRMAKKLGFDVVVAEAGISSDVAKTAETVNSCDVLMGVHGAGLTNLLFLPINAVFIQIVPLGGLEWLSRVDFGEPAFDMKLKYLEYKIKEEESSLVEQYPKDHLVFKDPFAIHKKGWVVFQKVFLDNQDVKVDVNRFKGVLLKALKLLHD